MKSITKTNSGDEMLMKASNRTAELEAILPKALKGLDFNQSSIPRIAKDLGLMADIEAAVKCVPTEHRIFTADSRNLSFVDSESVHLVVCSPPYWTLKDYDEVEGQLGYVSDYQDFLLELDAVWKECLRVLVPGGRLVCVVGDVCLSRRKNGGIHTVIPLHSSIQEHCRALGFTNLAPIFWYKIANAVYEATGSAGAFLGKPYEPNGIIKNDVEFLLMLRKPGGYRTEIPRTVRLLSTISAANHQTWFQQVWSGVTGASTRSHPAPYPIEVAERLIRMFSFVGDVVLDPFLGSGSTAAAAAACGRNSIGVEVSEQYVELTMERLAKLKKSLPRASFLHEQSAGNT
jgi:DNA modification methylase